MREITVAENPEWTIPALDYIGVPTGIDVRRVVETGIAPTINAGIAHVICRKRYHADHDSVEILKEAGIQLTVLSDEPEAYDQMQ